MFGKFGGCQSWGLSRTRAIVDGSLGCRFDMQGRLCLYLGLLFLTIGILRVRCFLRDRSLRQLDVRGNGIKFVDN